MAPPLHRAIQSPERFADSVDAYIAACLTKDDSGKDSDIISIAGLALALGCNKDMIARWRDKYSEPTEHDPQCLIGSALKKLNDSSEQQLERQAVLGRNSMALVLGKIKHKWVEEQHIKHDVKASGSISVITGVSKPEQ